MDGAVLQACHVKVSQQLILFAVLINYFIISTTIQVVGVLDKVLHCKHFLSFMIYDLFRVCSMSKREVVSNLVQIQIYIPTRQYPYGLIFY